MRRLPPLMLLMIPFAQAQDAAPPAAPPSFETQSKSFEQAIAAMAKVDQKHPDFLGANLDYASLLSREAEGDCTTRITTAQSLYDTVRNSPVTLVVLPEAAGRLPFTGYSIEMARYRCAKDDAEKKAHLLAAQKLARQGVEGYRSGFFYDSMAVMQYNVAQSYSDLGDKAQALKELQAAIDMDRTYGLRRDAEDNYRNLRDWQGEKATDDDVAKFMATMPLRSAKLTFAWKPVSVQSTGTFDLASFEADDVKHTKFTLPFKGKISKEKDLFVYSLKGGEPVPDAVEAKQDSGIEKRFVALMGRIMGQLPVAEITADGEFKGVRDIDVLVKTMSKEIDEAVTNSVPADDKRLPAIKSAVDAAVRPRIAPEVLLAKFQEEYALDTGIWIGATLEHGTWMEMPLVMTLNGTPQGFVNQQTTFVLSRWLPCGNRKTPDCVELVLDARPDAKAIAEIAQKMTAGNQGRFDYAGRTRRRIVVDPATLTVYESESRRYGYLAITANKQRAVKIDSEKGVVTYRYSN